MKSVLRLAVLTVFLMVLSCQQDSYFSEETTSANLAEEAHVLINRAAPVPDHRSCGSDALMEALLQDPEYALEFRRKMKEVESMTALRATCTNPVRIPVAVHFQGVQSPDRACLEALAVAQIASLTKDYQAANSDMTLWTNSAASSFPGVTVRGACVTFQIANSNHPAGFNLANGSLAVTINQTTGDRDARWAGYLNIYVVPNTGYLGYSPLGGAGNGDGVVIDSKAFGLSACGAVGGEAPYNKGRTLTHEVGHYFLLDHIWGDGCAVDDGISDTPNMAAPNYGCPALTVRSCNSLDMHMNYMDYTDDACMYMFTAGQATRMENYISSSLSNIVAKGASVFSGGSGGGGTSTCSDGIQNGDETGIDCGGSCGPCQTPTLCASPTTFTVNQVNPTSVSISFTASTSAQGYRIRYKPSTATTWTIKDFTTPTYSLTSLTAGTTYQYQVRTNCSSSGWQPWSATQTFTVPNTNTCNDGIQNGDETGIDCGGSCGPCQTPTTCASPTTFTTAQVDATSVNISFTGSTSALGYRIRYKASTATTWVAKDFTAPNYTITGLTAGATYQYQVRTNCSSSGWQLWSATQTFTVATVATGCSGYAVQLRLTLDSYGSETSWLLKDATGKIVQQGGPYTDRTNGKVVTSDFCLSSGCYTLVVKDAVGDGMCCTYGNGKIELLNGNGSVIVSSNGRFGKSKSIAFCTGSGRSSEVSIQADEPAENLPPKSDFNTTNRNSN